MSRLGRLIPAHAGKTLPWPRGQPRVEAHPRSRGENVIGQLLSAVGEGSSPLTRGKRVAVGGRGDARGLIPAHAGKTARGASRRSLAAAHPRSRGENARYYRDGNHLQGSSPLTRGKLEESTGDLFPTGLIPAHAGKTQVAGPLASGKRGSSPLTRGKHAPYQPSVYGVGLIPAHAGKTPAYRAVGHDLRAHPRSRGENRRPWPPVGRAAGSSPLTRGKRGRWG